MSAKSQIIMQDMGVVYYGAPMIVDDSGTYPAVTDVKADIVYGPEGTENTGTRADIVYKVGLNLPYTES